MPELNQDEKAIIQKDDAYNKRIQPIPNPEKSAHTENDGIIDRIITGQNGISSQLDLGTINSFTQVSQRRDQVFKLIDGMSEDSIISAILETYAEDATEYNDNGQIIWAEASDKTVAKFVTFLLDSLQVDKHAYSWVHSLCKYGDLYLELFRNSEVNDDPFMDNKDKSKEDKTLNEDIKVNAYKQNDKYIHYIEMAPNPATMFELTRYGKTSGYIKTDITSLSQNNSGIDATHMDRIYQYKFRSSDINIYNPDKFVHATLEDNTSRTPEEVTIFKEQGKNNAEIIERKYIVKRGQSLLYNTFKIWRELSLLENSMLLNRVTKSAIVRLINVEVGDMPKENVGPHLQGIKQLMEQKAAIDTGGSMTEYTNPGPIENNIYVPTYNGKGAISADQIGGDVNISQLPDIEYFQNKFFGSMRIPKQYFGLTDDGAGFNGGESLAIISSRYAKMIKRIQNALIQALTDAINLMLIDKGLSSYVNQFTIKMQPPTTKEEVDRRENLSSKVSIVSDIMNLLTDIEDPTTKMKILKSLISGVITDNEVIGLIDDEIKRLENPEENPKNPEENPDEANLDFGDNDFGDIGSGTSNIDTSSEDILDQELGLTDDEISDESDEDSLPTPDELNIDMTDNTNEF